MEDPPPSQPPSVAGSERLPLGRWFLIAGSAVALAFTVASAVVVGTVGTTGEARSALVDVIDPAALRVLELSEALTVQGSAVRAYGATGDERYMEDYREAAAAESASLSALEALISRMPERAAVRAELDALRSASAAWRRGYGDRVAAAGPAERADLAEEEYARVGGERFRTVQAALTELRGHLTRLHGTATTRLVQGWQTLYAALGGMAAILVLAGIGFALIVRHAVLRPVAELTGQVRAVAHGDFGHALKVERPAELAELSGHVDAMRRRIVAEWRRASEAQDKLEEQADELRRSNAELEQFAYVASHDLQEPLRKVASFTQILEQRYGDRLDDRARQYIAFAVDGAKRMQSLISDLLDFSRVGRAGGDLVPLDVAVPLDAALENLASQIEEAGATVTRDDLPRVLGNRAQLTQLFQNLVGNAVKFRSREAPRVHIGVRRAGDAWEFSCSDNGIGIEDKHSERIFLIFQRLHGREAYSGTGIGLALCKKIVEYHGGRIWVDNGEPDDGSPGEEGAPAGRGTTFRWTLLPGDADE
ncbi:bacteriophytochrome-like protein [Planomonospora sphaerica]|uniref:histidine kinase n=1 Tax=Planomonospora sphaerica TaxID=161355 RepID=A0A161LQI0_9ACTN|nr:ATP-binding protein [Planomonospora sphaerica]GAT69676.1 bacteriophytochrome-like protein [Planomonospora sphaerica]